MTKQTVTLANGTEIAYLERPGGEQKLLLLHGITDNATTYAPLMARIDARCHIYAMDFRGHGASSRMATTYTADGYVDDVVAFIQEVVGGPTALAGHSLGGLVSVRTAARAPELVRCLVLEDPPLYFVGKMDAIYEAAFNAIVVMATTLQDGSRSRQEWFDLMAAAPDPYSGKPGIETMGEDRINYRLDSIGQMHPKALQDALDGSLREELDIDADLKSLGCPTTLIVGERSLGSVMTAEDVTQASALIPNCQVVALPGVGHLVHDQRPDDWLKALNQALA